AVNQPQALGALQTVSVTNVSLTGGFATLTTASGSVFGVGQTVIVSGLVNGFFNGTYTITGGTATTFSYRLNHPNVPFTADSGTATTTTTTVNSGASLQLQAFGNYSDANRNVRVTAAAGTPGIGADVSYDPQQQLNLNGSGLSNTTNGASGYGAL